MPKKIKFLMSKPGVDGHWRGAVTVSMGLRDAGMEVVFGGFQSIEQIVKTAIEEDVDIIGMSIHSGAHLAYTKNLVESLERKGLRNKFMILVGGAIPEVDFEELKKIGAANVYGPGSLIKDIIAFIREKFDQE
ncbi:MAG: cobalamin B12-binding domain-containing protein [Candidatus Jordarchaeum sp.]|uniref:cobalamin B12-binding domain-containing protein n=1 Tax=Candidatus Jordarchaeum sp. TaxID=2823881 RepID=UPI00404B050A